MGDVGNVNDVHDDCDVGNDCDVNDVGDDCNVETLMTLAAFCQWLI